MTLFLEIKKKFIYNLTVINRNILLSKNKKVDKKIKLPPVLI